MYYSSDRYHALIVARSHLEYYAYSYCFTTAWNNVLGFSTNQGEPALVLQKPAAVFGVNGLLNPEELNIETRRIPLKWFDYPNNTALVRDLQRYMVSWPSSS